MTRTKRISSPKIWKIERKTKMYIISPKPGAHAKEKCVSLGMVLRDILRIVENIKEIKYLLNKKVVRVDGVVRTDHRFPVGVMDIISIENDNYRIIPGKTGFIVRSVGDGSVKLYKIVGKTHVKNKKTQLHFHDGRNMIVDKDMYKTGDVAVFDVEKHNMKDLLKFEKGVTVLIVEGKNRGMIGKIEDIVVVRGSQPNRVIIKIKDKIIETLKDYTFVIGRDKPIISITE